MARKQGATSWDLRIERVPGELHARIDQWRKIHSSRTGEDINKGEAAIKLLERATKNVKIPKSI
jgi:hypothetical protein